MRVARFQTVNCLECGAPMKTFAVPDIREIHRDQLSRLQRDLIALAVAHHLDEISDSQVVAFGARAAQRARDGQLRADLDEQGDEA
jgi:hypothetical protein